MQYFKLYSVTKALPESAGSVSTDGVCIGEDGGDFVIPHEFVLHLPVLTATELPKDETVIYKVEQDADDTWTSGAETLIPEIARQTGGASGGAAAATVYFRVPSNAQQYIRVTATTSTNAGDCKAKSVVLDFNV